MSEESNTFILHLRTRWFSAIKTRDKTMEGRLYRNQVQQMKPKDKVIFICEKDQDGVADQIVVRIRSIYVANSSIKIYSLFGKF
jgi:ASC-1-like (ASCH) protein